MGFDREIAAGVSGNVNLVAFLQHVEGRKHHAGFRPQAGDDELLAAGRDDGLSEIRVQPGVHRGSVDDVVHREKFESPPA